VSSCNVWENDYHLPSKKMEDVLMDVNLAESYSTLVKDARLKGLSKNTDTLSGFYKDIFAHHGISDTQFSQSYAWYRRHPVEMDTIYNHLIIRITDLQAAHTKNAQKK
jgi:Domain of unknown function (DUF4296)